jgi:hypothetical protein
VIMSTMPVRMSTQKHSKWACLDVETPWAAMIVYVPVGLHTTVQLGFVKVSLIFKEL